MWRNGAGRMEWRRKGEGRGKKWRRESCHKGRRKEMIEGRERYGGEKIVAKVRRERKGMLEERYGGEKAEIEKGRERRRIVEGKEMRREVWWRKS